MKKTLTRLRKRPRQVLGNWLVRTLGSLNAADLFAKLATKYVQPLHKNSSGSNGAAADPYTVLVLDAARFRGDLDYLSQSPRLRFLTIDWEFLRMLVTSFVEQAWTLKRAEQDDPDQPFVMYPQQVFHAAAPDSKIGRQRAEYRAFLRAFLPVFFDRLGVDAVITSDLRFRRQSDLCQVASELGYPYLLFQRESMFIVPSVLEFVALRHKIIGRFWGDAVVAQNQVTKEMFLASGSFDENQIVVAGCARMDGLIERVKDVPPSDGRTIVVFAGPRDILSATGKVFFDIAKVTPTVLRVAARLARNDPSIRVMVKMKEGLETGQGQGKLKTYQDAIRDEVGEILPNIVFESSRMAAHDLIMKSTIVVALQSTVVLEAGLAGKPVILPHFEHVRNHPDARNSLMYLDHHALFDVPDTEADLERMLLARLRDPKIPEDVMAARRELFARHVSPLEGTATRHGIELICEWAETGRRRRKERASRASNPEMQAAQADAHP